MSTVQSVIANRTYELPCPYFSIRTGPANPTRQFHRRRGKRQLLQRLSAGDPERHPAPSCNRRLYGPPSCVHRMCAAAQALFRTIFVHSGRHLLRLSAGVAVPGILRGAVKKIHQKLLLDDDPLSSSFAGTDQTVHVAFYRHRPPGQICFGRRHPQFTGDYGPRRPDRTSGREGRGLPGDARGGTLGGFQAIFRFNATLLCRLDSDTPIR